MALKDFLALNDVRLGATYAHVPYNPAKDRKKFVAALDKAAKAFADDQQPRGKAKFFSISNKVAKVTPNLSGTPVTIDGKTAFHVPSERLADALRSLKAATNAGELDANFEAASKAPAPIVTPPEPKRRGRPKAAK